MYSNSGKGIPEEGDNMSSKKKKNPPTSVEDPTVQEAMALAKDKANGMVITVSPPNLDTVAVCIRGTSPYVQNRFGRKALEQMIADQEAGSTKKKGKGNRPAKDFDALYKDAMHVSTEGWYGIPAATFRNAMVSACRVVGFQMTKAKLTIFTEADGYGVDGTPLVRITKGEPHPFDAVVRNATGVADIRRRPMFDPGWEAEVRIVFDRDMFTPEDIYNLIMRVGLQVGVGEGRHDSKSSTGMGWGTFEVVQASDRIKAA